MIGGLSRKEKLLLVSGLSSTLIVSSYFLETTYHKLGPSSGSLGDIHENCLTPNQHASYFLTDNHNGTGDAVVSIRNEMDSTSSSFTIKNLSTNYYPVDLQECALYFIKDGLDFKIPNADFAVEIWASDYRNNQFKLLTLADWPKGAKEASVYYAYDFRVDPSEKYIALERSFYPKPDYALDIKNIETKQDAFVLPMTDVQKEHPNIVGSFDLGRWVSLDGEFYLWGDIFEGAYASAYYRVKRDSWEVEIWPTPNDFVSGVERAGNPYGYLAYVNIPTFTGTQELTESILDEAVRKGIQKELIVTDLKTGKKKVIESIDPHYRFNIKWSDDWKTLYYELPSGIRKTYNIAYLDQTIEHQTTNQNITLVLSLGEFMITDSQGRRTGRLSNAGLIFTEIPGSQYYYESIGNPESTGTTSENRDATLYIPQPISSRYTLNVLNQYIGPYNLELLVEDIKGSTTKIIQATSSGAVDTYLVTYSKSTSFLPASGDIEPN